MNQYISNRISDIDLFDATGFKPYEESISVLRELNEAGFKVIVISDSSLKIRPLKVLKSCGFEQFIYSLVTFSEIGKKKSSLEYFRIVQNFLGLGENCEIWVIGNKVHKEILSAAKNGIKHIWINQLVTDIDLNKSVLENQIQYPRSIMSLCLLSNAITYYEPSGIKVAYMLPTTKKMHIMGLKKTFTSSSSFWYNSIWPYCSPKLTGEYQVFLNKAVDLLSMNSNLSLQAFHNWQQFLSHHPEIHPIDPLNKCQEWLTREDFVKSLSECINTKINDIKFRVPFQIKVNKNTDIESISIEFPLIIKANSASVTKMSHIMSLVFNRSGLKEAIDLYEEECIIQEFINHDMTVYKIYVIGNQIEYKPRPSCSNVSFSGKNCVTFNSAEPWPEDLKSGTRVVKDLNKPALFEATQRISSQLGLSIFGYDILVHSQTEDYIVVDVNVFPGFKEYPNLNPLLENLIVSLPNITNIA